MFKKTACFLLAVLLLLTTTACQKTPDEGSSVPASSASDNVEGAGDSNGTSSGNPLQKADSIAYYKQGNATLKLGTVMSDGLLKALGTPTDTTEAPSCHYDGMDIIYTYDHISVYTYRQGDQNIIYAVDLNDDKVSTMEGVRVGMSQNDVKAVYGEPTKIQGNTLSYTIKNGEELTFTLDDNKVLLIEYYAE